MAIGPEASTTTDRSRRALIVVDVQNDFCEGGSLAVVGGARIAAEISQYLARHRDKYTLVLASLDDHVADSTNCGHIALAPDEPDFVESWPPHCISGTVGAQLHPDLDTSYIDDFVRKGQGVPAYSAFEGHTLAGRSLNDLLIDHGIESVDVVGLATDYCVAATARAASTQFDLRTAVIANLCAAVHADQEQGVLDELAALPRLTIKASD